MAIKDDLIALEWEYATGAIGYLEYRDAVKRTWANQKIESKEQTGCKIEYDPEPHIAARTTLMGGDRSR